MPLGTVFATAQERLRACPHAHHEAAQIVRVLESEHAWSRQPQRELVLLLRSMRMFWLIKMKAIRFGGCVRQVTSQSRSPPDELLWPRFPVRQGRASGGSGREEPAQRPVAPGHWGGRFGGPPTALASKLPPVHSAAVGSVVGSNVHARAITDLDLHEHRGTRVLRRLGRSDTSPAAPDRQWQRAESRQRPEVERVRAPWAGARM